MRESIVIQVGNYSNYVGSHFWNIQSSYNATGDTEEGVESEKFEGSRLYRPSRDAPSGYVPRVLMGDLSEDTGHVLLAGESTVATAPKARASDETGKNETALLWDGTTRRIQQDHYPVHPFQIYQQTSAQMLTGMIDPTSRDYDFFTERTGVSRVEASERPDERTILRWSDYMGTPVHSKSYLEMPSQYNHQNFDHFAAALNHDRISFASVVDRYMESFRYFSEECDTLTSVQIFADCYDGFSVLTKELVEEIREDYRGVAMPIWAVVDAPVTSRSSYVWQGNRDIFKAKGLKETLGNLSFSYSAARLFDGGASAVIPISGAAAMASFNAAYPEAMSTLGQPRRTGMGESEKSSPGYQSTAESLDTRQNLRYLSSSTVATGIDGVIGMDFLRGSNRLGLARDHHVTSKVEGVTGNSSHGDMWDILYHATNAGRFPCLNLEVSLPLSSSPTALLSRIDTQFTSNASTLVTESMPSFRGYINPFLSSLSAAQYHTELSRCNNLKKGRGFFPIDKSENFTIKTSHAKVVEDADTAMIFDSTEEEDVLEEMYRLSDMHLDSKDTNKEIGSTLSNVICLRGALAKQQFGFDKYLWSKTNTMDSYAEPTRDVSSRRYFLTRFMQRESAMRAPLAFPSAIRDALASESSHKNHQSDVSTITAIGADATATPRFLLAHAALWKASGGSKGGPIQSQLHKVGLELDDTKEIAEILYRIAGNYKDDLM